MGGVGQRKRGGGEKELALGMPGEGILKGDDRISRRVKKGERSNKDIVREWKGEEKERI